MANDDYYQALGVSRSASQDDIRKSYKKLAREFHPDARPDDKAAAERFKEIQNAYAVLSDPEKRKKYDQFGPGFENAGHGPQFDWSNSGGDVDLSDLFGGLFGGGGGQPRGFGGGFSGFGGGTRQQAPRAQRGEDIRAEIEIPFQLAAEGGNYDLHLNRGGKSETLTVKIPPGVNSGSVIRLSGQGQEGRHGGPAGNLLVTIKAHAHPFFRRDGNNLLIDVPITPSEAVLGAKIDVPTLTEGTVVLTVPPRSTSGSKLRLRGKGIRHSKTGERGDQIVVLKVDVPADPCEPSRELYQKLAEIDSFNPRQGLW